MKLSLLAAGALLVGLASTTVAQAQTAAYITWPLSRANTDSAAVRSTGITPGTTRFVRYVLSSGQPVTISGTTTMAYPPYSKAMGQAFGINASGGGWSSNATPAGPGTTIRRGFAYEEFSFTASAALQVDSLIFTIATPNSAAGNLALTYSKSGFTTDSAEFLTGKGPNGALPATANGSFTTVGMQPSNAAAANKLVYPQYDATLADRTRTYRMAFNGATGLQLVSGNKVAVRFLVGVGSSSDGRYVLLKNVTIKSKQTVLATRAAVATNLGLYPNPAQSQLTVPHAAAKAGAQVLVYNATGARVLAQAVQPGSLETNVGLEALTRGLYLVEYADGDNRSTARLVKE